MSKGSWQRPAQVSREEQEANWRRTFGFFAVKKELDEQLEQANKTTEDE
jgi:hypothetical protein